MKNGPYELVVAPEGYPGKRYRDRYAYEHHVAWWRKTGSTIGPKEVIHHKNGNKRDNRFTNLELLGWADHTRFHAKVAPVVDMKCSWCENKFERLVRDVRSKRKQGQTRFYCCKSHQVRDQQRRRKSTD